MLEVISPWTVLGWMLVGVLGIIATIIAIALICAFWSKIFMPWCRTMKLHLQTRNILPEKGQRWIQNGHHIINITHITDEGRICINSHNAGWSDSPEDWKKRVRSRKLYLLRRKDA